MQTKNLKSFRGHFFIDFSSFIFLSDDGSIPRKRASSRDAAADGNNNNNQFVGKLFLNLINKFKKSDFSFFKKHKKLFSMAEEIPTAVAVDKTRFFAELSSIQFYFLFYSTYFYFYNFMSSSGANVINK